MSFGAGVLRSVCDVVGCLSILVIVSVSVGRCHRRN